MAENGILFACTWGDIILFVSSLEWEGGNTQVVHELATGDLHPMQPRGARHAVARAELQFDDFGGGVDGTTLFRRFEATVGERRIFTHPVDGSYFARMGPIRNVIDSSSVITASVEIYPDQAIRPVSPAGAGASGTSGEISVVAAAGEHEQKLADAGIGFAPSKLKSFDFTKSVSTNIDASFSASAGVSVSASVGVSASAAASASASAAASASAQASAFAFAGVYADALAVAQASAVADISGMGSPAAFAFAYASAAVTADARATVTAWNQDENLTARQVQIDAARLSESIATMIEVGGFELDLALFPAFKVSIMLGESVRSAAIASTSSTPSVFVMRVMTRTALLPLAAKIYGGFDAQRRADQIMGLQVIRTPGWLDPGYYLMPSRPPPGSPLAFGAS